MTTQPQHWIKEIASRLSILCCVILLCGTLFAQPDRTITIRMLDNKTGQQITTSEFQISFQTLPDLSKIPGLDHYWMEGGERHGILTIPFEPGTVSIAVHSSYRIGFANWSYVNCDCVRDRGPYQEHWYSISEILASGIAAPNRCNKRKVIAKPGEFIFFVRPMTFWEKMRE
jgi:hypothetical protein